MSHFQQHVFPLSLSLSLEFRAARVTLHKKGDMVSWDCPISFQHSMLPKVPTCTLPGLTPALELASQSKPLPVLLLPLHVGKTISAALEGYNPICRDTGVHRMTRFTSGLFLASEFALQFLRTACLPNQAIHPPRPKNVCPSLLPSPCSRVARG